MEDFNDTDNLANLFVTKYYNIAANAANIPNVQNDVAQNMNMIANPDPIVRNVTLPTYRALLAEASRQIDALRGDDNVFNTIAGNLHQFFQNGINQGLWDEFGPAPPPPELRRNGGTRKNKSKRKRNRKSRYFRTNRKRR